MQNSLCMNIIPVLKNVCHFAFPPSAINYVILLLVAIFFLFKEEVQTQHLADHVLT